MCSYRQLLCCAEFIYINYDHIAHRCTYMNYLWIVDHSMCTDRFNICICIHHLKNGHSTVTKVYRMHWSRWQTMQTLHVSPQVLQHCSALYCVTLLVYIYIAKHHLFAIDHSMQLCTVGLFLTLSWFPVMFFRVEACNRVMPCHFILSHCCYPTAMCGFTF